MNNDLPRKLNALEPSLVTIAQDVCTTITKQAPWNRQLNQQSGTESEE
jgi:hypothetical protein